MLTPAALAGLPAVTSSVPITSLGSPPPLLPPFTSSSSSGMLNLLPLSAPKALPSTSGVYVGRVSAIQTGGEDLEVGVRGNGGDAPRILVSETRRR